MNGSHRLRFSRLPIPSLCCLLWIAARSPADPPSGRIRLTNGDSFAATPLEFNREEFRIRVPWSPDALSIDEGDVQAWWGEAARGERQGGSHRLWLHSGDRLEGELRGLDADTCRLRLPWDETLSLPLSAIRRINWLPPPDRVRLAGPGPLSAWVSPPGHDTRRNVLSDEGGFIRIAQRNRMPVHRILDPVPERFTLDITVDQPGPPTPYTLYLLSSANTVYRRGTLTASWKQDGLRLSQHRGNPLDHTQHHPGFSENSFPHAYQLTVDRPGDRLELRLNGALLKSGSLHGMCSDSGPQRISIRAEESGDLFIKALVLHEGIRGGPDNGEPPEDGSILLTLRNGDRLQAEAVAFDAGDTLAVRLQGGTEFNLPTGRVARLELPAPPRAPAPPEPPGWILHAAGSRPRVDSVPIGNEDIVADTRAGDIRIPTLWLDSLERTGNRSMETPSPPPSLRFNNGDAVSGDVSIAGNQLRVNPSWSPHPLPVDPGQVREIHLHPRDAEQPLQLAMPAPAPRLAASLWLTRSPPYGLLLRFKSSDDGRPELECHVYPDHVRLRAGAKETLGRWGHDWEHPLILDLELDLAKRRLVFTHQGRQVLDMPVPDTAPALCAKLSLEAPRGAVGGVRLGQSPEREAPVEAGTVYSWRDDTTFRLGDPWPMEGGVRVAEPDAESRRTLSLDPGNLLILGP